MAEHLRTLTSSRRSLQQDETNACGNFSLKVLLETGKVNGIHMDRRGRGMIFTEGVKLAGFHIQQTLQISVHVSETF